MAYSQEVQSIIKYLMQNGVAFRITDIDTPGVHTPSSYHYAPGTNGNGLAVDFAGLVPSTNSPALRRIVDAFIPVKGQLVEFLHPWNRADHDDHVHVAVPKGTFLVPIGDTVPDDPNLFNIAGPVSFHPICDSTGFCTGYYIFSTKTGEVHSYGPGAKYYGRSEVIAVGVDL